jgi:hypothetical protein
VCYNGYSVRISRNSNAFGAFFFILSNYYTTFRSVYNRKYDMICSFDVLEHIDDWKELVLQFANSSTQYILLSVSTGRMRKHELKLGHVRNFKCGEIESFMENETMFRPVKIYYAGFPFYSPIARDLTSLMNPFYETNLVRSKETILSKLISKAFFIFV